MALGDKTHLERRRNLGWNERETVLFAILHQFQYYSQRTQNNNIPSFNSRNTSRVNCPKLVKLVQQKHIAR